jgi:DNA-binding NarL/FixJ family response regulator
MDQLSGREREVAAALALGLSRKAIAAQAGLAEGTIVTLSRRVYRKLGVHNRAELATRLGARVLDGTPRG